MNSDKNGLDTDRTPFLPLAALETLSQPLFRLLAALLILAGVWALWNQATRWSRPVELVVGVPGAVQELQQDGRVRYQLVFMEQDTGETLNFWLQNNGPVFEYLQLAPAGATVALRYWTDDRTVVAIHSLVVDAPPIRERIPPATILLGTSILGLLLALALLLAGTLGQIKLRR